MNLKTMPTRLSFMMDKERLNIHSEKLSKLLSDEHITRDTHNTAYQALMFICSTELVVNAIVHTASNGISFKLSNGWLIEIDPEISDSGEEYSSMWIRENPHHV